MSKWNIGQRIVSFLCLFLLSISAHALSLSPYFSSHGFFKHQSYRFDSLNHFIKRSSGLAPTPIPLGITVNNANWVTTISICNNTTTVIPLTNLELDFTYAEEMPENIWGKPWVAWRVQSQVGNQVVLAGGTPYSAKLKPDANCRTPLTVSFNAAPTSPLPSGFIFKAEGGTPPPPTGTGNLNVTLGAAPAANLPNPILTIQSLDTTQSKAVTWGSTWNITGLIPGCYTITGSKVTVGVNSYLADPVTATVMENATAQATLTYKGEAATSGNVTITLVNPPSTPVPLKLVGTSSTVQQNITNGTVLTLPADTYDVVPDLAGYNVTAVPDPLTVPTNATLTITYSPVIPPVSNARTIQLHNECPFPVWFGFISGYTGTCAVESDCPAGSTCVDRGAGGKACFWKTPVPTNNNFRLEANGGTNSVTLPIYPNLDFIYSGAVAGRTGCTASGCQTADCGAGTGACPAGRGFAQPATQAEFTLGRTNTDFYNIELINGLNLPISMAPVLTGAKDPNPYNCGAPGTTNPLPPLGGCNWDFTPPAVEYNWVRAGGAACNANADCAAPAKCGLSFNPGQTPLLKKTCGTPLGYWTANQVCGIQPTYGAPFNCQQQLPAPNSGLNLSNLYGCVGVGSCYQPQAPNSCCGCANWDTLGLPVPPAPYTQQCVNKNPNWVSLVQPTLLWLKKACPAIYTYPFDDMSSTFTCQIMNNGVNRVDYTITFCPGGKTGGVVG